MAKATTTPKSEAKQQKTDAAGKMAKSGPKTPAKSKAPAKPNFFQRLMGYFRDVRTEMKRVVWPTREDVLNSSVVVIITLLFFMVFTFAVDQLVVQALRVVASLKGVVG